MALIVLSVSHSRDGASVPWQRGEPRPRDAEFLLSTLSTGPSKRFWYTWTAEMVHLIDSGTCQLLWIFSFSHFQHPCVSANGRVEAFGGEESQDRTPGAPECGAGSPGGSSLLVLGARLLGQGQGSGSILGQGSGSSLLGWQGLLVLGVRRAKTARLPQPGPAKGRATRFPNIPPPANPSPPNQNPFS